MEKLELINAEKTHESLLLMWANDAEVRKNAFHSARITSEEHQKWYAEKLKSQNTYLFICKIEEKNIGQIRLDICAGCGEISFSVDKEYRGQGYGLRILEALEKKLYDLENGKKRLCQLQGKVKYDNIPSQKCFEKLGYKRNELAEYIVYQKEILFL